MEQKGQLAAVAIVFIIAIAIIAVVWVTTYNNLVGLDTKVTGKWADVQAQYQRRFDLIPNLVNSVKGYMTYEQGLLTNITQLRSQWESATTMQEKVSTGQALDAGLGRLIAVSENYPDLKSQANVQTLMVQLEGTENRVSVARMDYNDAVRAYQSGVRGFPGNLFGWSADKYPYFQAGTGAENPVTVNI